MYYFTRQVRDLLFSRASKHLMHDRELIDMILETEEGFVWLSPNRIGDNNLPGVYLHCN